MKLFRRLTALFIVLFAFVTVLVVANVNAAGDTEEKEDVVLKDGVYTNGAITWEVAEGNIIIKQEKGNGNAVNSSYIEEPRIYVKNILSFTANDGYLIKKIQFTYSSSRAGSSELTVNDLTASEGGNDQISINWGATSGSITIPDGLNIVTIVNGNNDNVQLRPTAISVTYVTPQANTYTVTFDSNGGNPVDSVTVDEGSLIELITPTHSNASLSFAGWYNGDEEWDFENDVVESDITLVAKWDDLAVSNIKTKLSAINSYVSMGYRYRFSTEEVAVSVVDTLNRELTEIVSGSSTYSAWKDKTSKSLAVYAGQSAGGNNSIQLRTTNNNSGIVTTTSGGKATKVAITWNANTTNERIVSVYGSNTAYTSPTNLFDSAKQGELIGEVTYIKAQGKYTSEIMISGEYEYIGIRSKSGALYLEEVQITWEDDSYKESKCVYSDADFRMRFAIDSTISELAELSNGDENFEYGIAVSNGGKTVTYKADEYQTNLLDEYKLVYVTFKLFDENDDFADNFDRLTSEFTVCAYVVYNGEKYYSENEKTYSVKTLLEKYLERTDITNEDDKQALNYLKETFEEFGYTINK